MLNASHGLSTVERTHVLAGSQQHARTIGQVVLALRIFGANAIQGVEQVGAVEDVAAQVDFGDLLLCSGWRPFPRRCRRIRQPVAHDAAQPGRIRLCGRCRGCTPGGWRSNSAISLRSESALHQRRVAGHDQHRPIVPASMSRHIITAWPVPAARSAAQSQMVGRPASASLHVVGTIADDTRPPGRRRPPPTRPARIRSSAGRRPATSTLGRSDFIRVPLPAAITIASLSLID